jgi:hypothetical protein
VMIDFYLEFNSNPTLKEAVKMERKIKRCTMFLQVRNVEMTTVCL